MNKEDTAESIEETLQALKIELERIEKENQELYMALGLSPHMAQEILNDTTKMSQRLSPDACTFIQQERRALEELLEARLEKVRAKAQLTKDPSLKPTPSGHWIFVR